MLRFLSMSGLAICAVSACSNSETVTHTACLTETPSVISVAAGDYVVGGQMMYPEEALPSSVTLPAFDMDATEITVAQFSDFVNATAYVTEAEGEQVGFDGAGGAVFSVPSASNPDGWRFVEGANWRYPDGPDEPAALSFEPVVQVTLADARAYADWAGRALPSEAQWEAVAQSQRLKRGEDHAPERRANSWQGLFPVQDTAEDGYAGRAPVGCFEPNGLGAYDMVGNAWEWTGTPVTQDGSRYLIKGGSYLCAENFCRRDRPNSRQFQEVDLSTNHIGFRTVSRPQ